MLITTKYRVPLVTRRQCVSASEASEVSLDQMAGRGAPVHTVPMTAVTVARMAIAETEKGRVGLPRVPTCRRSRVSVRVSISRLKTMGNQPCLPHGLHARDLFEEVLRIALRWMSGRLMTPRSYATSARSISRQMTPSGMAELEQAAPRYVATRTRHLLREEVFPHRPTAVTRTIFPRITLEAETRAWAFPPDPQAEELEWLPWKTSSSATVIPAVGEVPAQEAEAPTGTSTPRPRTMGPAHAAFLHLRHGAVRRRPKRAATLAALVVVDVGHT
jgi:hypothetical protein